MGFDADIMEKPLEGVAKLKLKEMGSRYFFIVAYLWLENTLAVETIDESDERFLSKIYQLASRTGRVP